MESKWLGEVESIVGGRRCEKEETETLIKWKGMLYVYCMWVKVMVLENDLICGV